MKEWTVILEIFLKEGIFDPQGKTIRSALHSLGFEEVKEVRVGKVLKIKIMGNSEEEVMGKVRKMSEMVLVNPVTEDFSIRVEKE